MTGQRWFYKCAWAFLASTAISASLHADVLPPLEAKIAVVRERPDGLEARILVSVPRLGANREAKVDLKLKDEGIARIDGRTEWSLEAIEVGKTYSFDVVIRLKGLGEGSLEVQAESFDAQGHKLWGRADALFFLNTPEDRLHGRSSAFELKREKLRRDLRQKRLSREQYQDEVRKLMRGEELQFERRMRGKPEKVQPQPVTASAVVDTTVVSGRMTYTQRIGRPGGADVFAAAAAALPVRRSLVRFFDSNGATLTPLTSVPATVRTDDSGSYSATVPGKRADSTAVNLVVRLVADNPGSRAGAAGQRAVLHSRDSAAVLVDSATETVDIVLSDTDLTSLRVFAIQDGMLTSYDFVVSNNASTGVGAAPAQIFVEFPGSNAKGSFFSTSPDDHLNIGQGHAFDWDVYTHEYGHYIQKINNTTQNPGGCHYINGNNTGFNQMACGGANRVLSKLQAIRLAWGEGWPTFFGTNLQIASGAGALGIYSVADTRYTDTANNFTYDLEGNADRFATLGEDNELSVQRILWDFADNAQDGHDELAYGTDDMWRQLAGDSSVVTLEAFRSKLDGRIPASPAFYSTGTAEQNRARQGRIYFDLTVGPEPTAPADNAAIVAATPPTFRWNTRGAGPSPSYRFNRFNVLFFTEDYSRLIFTSPEVTTAGNADTAEWTPTAAEWATITAADPSTLTNLIKWAVQGKNDSLAPTTGFYRGLDRTLGALDIAFVIDDTGSMSEEIGGVRDALVTFIAELRSRGLTPLIEVITFKDDVTHRIISRNLDDIQAVVSGLFASGGGDCPESSAEALLDAAKNLGSGKKILFATDASSHRGFSLTGIEAEIRNRGIELREIVTGDCVSSGPRGEDDNPNHDPDYRPVSRLQARPDVYHDVTCPDCPPDDSAGPALSANALAPVGDFFLPEVSAIAAYQEIAAASPTGGFFFYPGVNGGDPLPFTNAVANTALSTVIPTVIAVQPIDVPQGATLDVLVVAGHTNFQGASAAAFSGTGITVNSTTRISPTTLRLNLTVAGGAAPGFRDVSVVTPLGDGTFETAGGTGQLRVVGNPGAPVLTSILPATLARGATADIVIWGLNTSFAPGVSLSISGLTVNSLTVLSPTSLRANVTVSPGAVTGFHTVLVQDGAADVSLSNVFSIVAANPLDALPSLSAVAPLTGTRGSTLTVQILGLNTHFAAGVSTVSFSGTGIAVLSATVISPTEMMVQVAVAPDAALGFRDVIVTTGGEVASQPGGFLIGGGVVPIPTLSPAGLAALFLLLGSAALWLLRRQRKGTA